MKLSTLTLSVIVLLTLLVPHMAAQSPVEVFGGFAYMSLRPGASQDRLNLNGWHSTLSYFPARRLGLAADFGGNYGDLDQHSFVFGPQVRLLRRGRLDRSFRALFGAVEAEGESAFGSTFGGAFDIRLTNRLAWRVQPGVFLTRYGGDLERNFRLPTGLVLHLGGER
jgi:hypothetical protein